MIANINDGPKVALQFEPIPMIKEKKRNIVEIFFDFIALLISALFGKNEKPIEMQSIDNQEIEVISIGEIEKNTVIREYSKFVKPLRINLLQIEAEKSGKILFKEFVSELFQMSVAPYSQTLNLIQEAIENPRHAFIQSDLEKLQNDVKKFGKEKLDFVSSNPYMLDHLNVKQVLDDTLQSIENQLKELDKTISSEDMSIQKYENQYLNALSN